MKDIFQKNSFVKLILILVAGVGLMLSYQNCGGPQNLADQAMSPSGEPEPDVVYPEKVCGKEGYQFLLDVYLVKHCGGCHNDDEFGELKITSANFETAYTAALTVSRAEWIETVTHNRFCAGDGCNLVPGEKRYNAVMEWLDNRYSCQ